MKLGIDIGNSTIKIVAINNNKIIYNFKDFHHGKIKEFLLKETNNLKKFNIENFTLGITGDNSLKFKNLNKFIINEIPCTIEGSKFLEPSIKTIIDIGSQNSKFITNFNNNGNLIFSTNTSCSAGTGSFLEEQASRLNISLEDISTLCKKSKYPVNIAGRCSVFSKTDITHHHQEGKKIEDILMGLSLALARNFRGNVVKKEKIQYPLLLIGGLFNNFGIKKAFIEVFNIAKNNFLENPNSNIATCIGASILARHSLDLDELTNLLEHTNENLNFSSNLKPLKSFGKNDSENKHKIYKNKEICEGYLGIDIGSTSTNLVLTDKDNNIIDFKYIRTLGNPVNAVEEGIKEIHKDFNNNIAFLSIVTTGSGRYLIGKKLNVDAIINEITTQAKGASFLYPKVDSIFEIGGQDSKYIHLNKGVVDDFEMNKICAAGTGSFLEEQSIKLGTPITEFSKIALCGNNPCDLGERCTVFIEGSINKAINANIDREDIYAGLCYSIVKNYLNSVVGNRSLGDNILLQGGIAYNQGVVNAFRAITGKNIIVTPYFSVTGAFGASLYAKEIFHKKIKKIQPITKNKNSKKDIFFETNDTIIDPNKKTVGIPRALFFYKLYPMFYKFFKSLGYNVILSSETNKNTINMSRKYSTIETCYPTKLINGHVAELVNKKVDYIFLPNLHEVKHKESTSKTNYSCIFMQSIGKMIDSNMNLNEKGIKLLNPSLTFKFGKAFVAKTLLEMGSELHISKLKTVNAIKDAMLTYARLTKHMEDTGNKILNNLKKDEKVFVLLSREYNIEDDVLNLEIPSKLKNMGYKVIKTGNIDISNISLKEEYPNLYWPFGQHLLSAAKVIKENPNLYAIHITNHGCGPDSILSHYLEEEMTGKPYLHIEVDEHSSPVGIITRLEAFVHSLEGFNGTIENWNYKSKLLENKNDNIYLEYSYPSSFLMKKEYEKQGKKVTILPQSTKESLETGKKFIRGKEYLSLTNSIGNIFHNIDKDTEGTFFTFQTCGSEVYGQYPEFISRKLHNHNYKLKVNAPFLEELPNNDVTKNIFQIYLLSDLIMIVKKERRNEYIDFAKKIIDNNYNKKDIIDFAKKIYIDRKKDSENIQKKKSLLITGEKEIISNVLLNKNTFNKLEEKYNIYYSPYSETLLFRWLYDNNIKIKDLKKYITLINEINIYLKEFSSFSKSLESINKAANKEIKFLNGGDTRYRLGKLKEFDKKVDGHIYCNSIYENSNILIKHILENIKNNLKPSINLEFDYSSHGNTNFLLDSFLYYL